MHLARLPVGGRIKYYRHKNGNRAVTVIAGLCGISERYLQLIESGKRIPSADVLARIAAELGVPIAALVSEEPVDDSPARITAEPAVARALMGYGAATQHGPRRPRGPSGAC